MNRSGAATTSLASTLVEMLKDEGVKRIFGIPGGGSSLALIEAAGRTGLDFVLTRTETAAAIMAAVTGELTAIPGVLLTGVGPGATSAVNGIAYASLEKAPVILITDGPASSPHQALDQNALYKPITKLQGRLQPADGPEIFARAIETAMTPPWGPVQLDLTAGDAAAPITSGAARSAKAHPPLPSDEALEKAHKLLSEANKPIILAGLEARQNHAPQSLQMLADTLGCPVLASYKASGVLPSSHKCFAGLFTGSAAESGLIHEADLIVFFGFDAIEIIPGEWPYTCPIVDLCVADATPMPKSPDVCVIGDLSRIVDALVSDLKSSDWEVKDIKKARKIISQTSILGGNDHTAQSAVEAAASIAPAGMRLTVDAGAHMFAALGFWPAEEAFGVFKSNGLSTMGYALPAAIALALEEPESPVLAVTGDGGMMMCLTELTTAIEHDCDITVLVINDAALSLIDIKQQRQQYRNSGVRYPGTDFARTAESLGCRAWRVEANGDLAAVLKEAIAFKGPSLVDVVANPDGYGEQLERLRG